MNKIKRISLDLALYLSYRKLRRNPSRQFVPVSWPRQSEQKIWDKAGQRNVNFRIRRKTTDWPVFEQIFLREDYRLCDLRQKDQILQSYQQIIDSGSIPLILDCGANNGLSTAWFALTYPNAIVMGIEPEAGNYSMAIHNTLPLNNVKLLHAAIAAKDGHLEIHDPGHGTSGFMTTNAEDIDNAIRSYSIPSLIDIAAQENPGRNIIPFIVNIDIEGFEKDLFSDNLSWIDKTPLIFVELHDWLLPGQSTASSFLGAVAKRPRDFVLRGENVISIAHKK